MEDLYSIKSPAALSRSTAGHRALSSLEGLQRSLQSGRSNEADALGSFDLHGCASLWVAASTGRTLSDLEGAKADELNATVFLHAFCDGGENGFESFASGALGDFATEVLLDEFEELCFVHAVLSVVAGIGAQAFPPMN